MIQCSSSANTAPRLSSRRDECSAWRLPGTAKRMPGRADAGTTSFGVAMFSGGTVRFDSASIGSVTSTGSPGGPGRRSRPEGSSRHVPSLFRQRREGNGRQPSTASSLLPGRSSDHQHETRSHAVTPDNFTIFEGHPTVQRRYRGTSGAHRRESCRKPMRTVEIVNAGQPAYGLYRPRSVSHGHKTRPTGRLARRLRR